MLGVLSIVLCVVVTALVLTCFRVMAEEENYFNTAIEDFVSIAIGIIALFGNYFASKVGLAIAIIFLVVEVIVMVAACIIAHGDDTSIDRFTGCSTLKEYLPFALLELLFTLTAMGASTRIAEFITNPFWASVVAIIPWMAFIVILTSFVVDYFNYRRKDEENNTFGVLAIIAAIIGLACLVWLIATHVNFNKPEPEPVVAVVEEVKPEPETLAPASEVAKLEEVAPSYHFFNLDLQDDGDASNDYDFGHNRYSAAVTAFENSHAEEDKETFIKNWLIADFEESLKTDPALAAADLAYADSILGTRFMGVFYESAKQDWAQAINNAKEAFVEDNTAWQIATTEFFGMLDTAEPSVNKIGQKVTDQMYMNPYTSDPEGLGPDVIVMETTDQTGHLLIFNLKIKGNTFKLGYRTECGYQPVNVADVMKIKAQPNPTSKTVNPTPTKTPTPTPNPTSSGPSPSPTPHHNDPDPNPPKYEKDKTKGTQGDLVAPNDNKGPGEDTNNGVGAKESTKDQPTNSTHYSDYKEKVQELKEANDSTPDVVPAANTTVDDNSAKGTGNGGIDTPTAVDTSTTTAEGSKISDEKPAGEWDGPPD